MKKKTMLVGVLAGFLLCAFTPSVRASSITVTVLSTAGPWDWSTGGLNSAYNYGPAAQDFTSPTTVDLLTTLGLNPGDSLYVFYKSGLTSAFNGVPPTVDQTGYNYLPFKDDSGGSSGQPFPSQYMPAYWGSNSADPGNAGLYGVFLQALVGAITDASGNVLSPFPVGAVVPFDTGGGTYVQSFGAGTSFLIPTNGRFLNLGFNDDTFFDNTGSMQVCIAGSQREVDACVDSTVVPEPATLALVGTGVGLGALRRRRRSRA